MRNLPNSYLDWSFADYSKDAVIQKSNICNLCAKSVALDRISLKCIQLDKLVEAPDPDWAIETGGDKAGVRVFNQLHGGHGPTMPLKCMHHLLGLHLEVPLEDKHVAKDGRNHKIVHRVVQKHISDAVSILSRLHMFQVSIIFFFRLLWVLCIVHSGYNSGAHSSCQVLKHHRQTHVILSFFLRWELVEVCISIWPADEIALFQVKF